MTDFKSIKDILDRLAQVSREDEILGIDIKNKAVQLWSVAFFKTFKDYETDHLGDGFTIVSHTVDGVKYYAYYNSRQPVKKGDRHDHL